MGRHTSTNDSQSEIPLKSMDPLAISISHSGRSHQSSSFQSIDYVGTSTNPHRRNTSFSYQGGSNTLPTDQPQATTPVAPISRNPQQHTTIAIPSDDYVQLTGGGEHTETQGNHGSGEMHQNNAGHDNANAAQVQPSTPGGSGKRDRIKVFATKTVPRLIYLHLLLYLPSLYFSRVERIFRVAELSVKEIKAIALLEDSADMMAVKHKVEHRFFGDTPETLPPVYSRLKIKWEELIDNLMEEWKTLNIISVLLLGSIMTMFQIDGASRDPITRYMAFCSLICALMSILYGCMFIVRFSTMRKWYKAAEWALEAQKDMNAVWNVWVMLSMPLLWLTWSIITFIFCVMTFMWRSRSMLPDGFIFPVPPHTEISGKIITSVVLGIGALDTLLIVKTLRRYGTQMDVAWKERVDENIELLMQRGRSAVPSERPAPPCPRAHSLGVLTENSLSDLG